MIIIADSGSTKTDWVAVDVDGPQTIKTVGFNPVYHTEEYIYENTMDGFPDIFPFEKVREVFYYGAGCWDMGRKEIVARALRRAFPKAEVEVDHDLLGAARSTCKDQPGIACIIGTGSNSCLFDGSKVIDNVTNLGWLVGDEGSGAFIGKELIRTYFYREMPSEIVELFEEKYGNKSKILDDIYENDQPNVYLASFTRFLSDNRNHVFIQKLIYQCLEVFIDRQVRKYKNHLGLPVHFIGSVAYYFQGILKTILEERAMQAGVFIQKPIDNLVHFHTSFKEQNNSI